MKVRPFSLYIDVHALQDRHYTGIPRVVFEIARFWWRRPGVSCKLFIDNAVLPPDVCDAIFAEGQSQRWRTKLAGYAELVTLHEAVASDPLPSIAFFPMHRKPVDAPFTRRVQMVHDLTSLLAPETHSETLLRAEALFFADEVAASDHIVAVSHSTKQHLLTYLGVDPAKVSVLTLGADPSPSTEEQLVRRQLGARIEPFALVLGTVEKRKNLSLVLDYLSANPDALERRRWIFVGRIRPDVFEALRPRLQGLERALRAKRMSFMGYVSETAKHLLLRKADLAVYPSLFEGFGLPVAEALWHGCPVAISYSTSLPEVGRSAAYYFSPFSPGDLKQALSKLDADLHIDAVGVRESSAQAGAAYRWSLCNIQLAGVLAKLVETVPDHGVAIETGPDAVLRQPELDAATASAVAIGTMVAPDESHGEPLTITINEGEAPGIHAVCFTVDGSGKDVWAAALSIRAHAATELVVQVDDGAENATQARFDLRAGLIVGGSQIATGRGRFGAAMIEREGDGWLRCAVVGSPGVTTDRVRLLVYLAWNGTVAYQGVGRSLAAITRVQMEKGPYPLAFGSGYRQAEKEAANGVNALSSSVEGGVFGVVEGGVVRGWARPRSGGGRTRVLLVGPNGRVASALAMEYRPELLSLGYGDGCYGFSLRVPMQPERALAVRVVAENEEAMPLPGGCLVLSAAVLPRAKTAVGRVTDIRYHDVSRRWLVIGEIESNQELALRLVTEDQHVIAVTRSKALGEPGKAAQHFQFSIPEQDLPATSIQLSVYVAGLDDMLGNCPFCLRGGQSTAPLSIEDALSTVAPTPDEVLADMPERLTPDNVRPFLRQLYTRALGRDADPAGLENYGRKLLDGGIQPREVVQALLGSPEATAHFRPTPILPPWM